MLTYKERRHALRWMKRWRQTKRTFDALRATRQRPLSFGAHRAGTIPMRKGAQPLPSKPKRGFFARLFKRTGV